MKETNAVHEALIELEGDSDEDLQARGRFVNAFPPVKKELEEGLSKLYALEEKVYKGHRHCTITNVVADCSVCQPDHPVTADDSLMLWTTGMGLGAVVAVAGARLQCRDTFIR